MNLSEVIHSIIDRRADKIYNLFISGREIQRASIKEICSLATKIKRTYLVSTGKMREIGEEAEINFREQLRKQNPAILEKYLEVKRAKADVESNFTIDGISEQQYKINYIMERTKILPSEQDFHRAAIRNLIAKKMGPEIERAERLRKTFKGKSLHEASLQNFLVSREIILNKSLDILHKSSLDSLLMGAAGGNRASFIYYFCMRWKNCEGVVDIAPDLKPFNIRNTQGDIEERDGTSKLFQLITTNAMLAELTELPIKHEMIIADFDLSKFGKRVGIPQYEKLESYLQDVKKHLNPQIEIIKQTQFFEALGFKESEYDSIFNSLYRNDGKFFSPTEFERELNHNLKSKARFLNNWDGESNRYYTASTIARNITEGLILSRSNQEKAIVVFDKNAIIGTQFNSNVSRKIPVICLPLYYDGIGNMKYA